MYKVMIITFGLVDMSANLQKHCNVLKMTTNSYFLISHILLGTKKMTVSNRLVYIKFIFGGLF